MAPFQGLDHSVGMGRTPYAIVPTMLSPVLESFHRRFSGYQGGPEEQDAQEFLLFLLDQIESELQLVKLKFKGQEGMVGACSSSPDCHRHAKKCLNFAPVSLILFGTT